MAYSGKITAANHADLLGKISSFITGDAATPGRDWVLLREDTLACGPARIFRNTGLSGNEQVNIGLYAASYTDGVKGGLVCKVYKAFDNVSGGTGFLDVAYGNGTGQNGTHAFMPAWNAAMNLWIWSNKARVLIVAECNGVYANAYLGQFRRFSLPSENPWPLCCLTDGYTNLWTNTTWHDVVTTTVAQDADQHRRSLPFVRRGCWGTAYSDYTSYQACHQVCRSDGVWNSHFVMCPTTSLLTGGGTWGEYATRLNTIGTSGISFSEGTERVLFPVYIMQQNALMSFADATCVGELYGVKWAPDKLASAESTASGYVLFPDINRVEWHSFMACGDE